VVLAAVLVLVATGCGGDSRREVVTQYIEDVNELQALLDAPARSITNASRQLTKRTVDDDRVSRRLLTAAKTIDRLRARLAALETPDEARRLRSLLVQLARNEAALARELAALTVFLPEFATALEPLQPAAVKLRKALAADIPLEAKAEALDAYAATLDGVLARLRPLRPPPVSAPTLATQEQTLTRMRSAAKALATALRDERAEDVPQLVAGFGAAAQSNQSLAAQKARIAAVKDYNARVKAVDTLILRIHRERSRLDSALD